MKTSVGSLMIIHVDMDAFYASVEQRDFPELRGQAVLVGGSGRRGVVCAASYESRAFGCRSAMPMSEAIRRCPGAIVRKPRFEVYSEVARQIRAIFEDFTPCVEPLSLDEAFLDVSASTACLGSPEKIGRQIKNRVLEETRLVASIGIGPVKFIAKLASDHGKPDGFVMIRSDEVLDFLAPLPIGRLWGVGKVTCQRLESMGIRTVGQLRSRDVTHLEQDLGSLGRHLWDLAHGRDERTVVPDRVVKSISNERTFDEDLSDEETILAELHALADEVAMRLRAKLMKARQVQLKIRLPNFKTITRQMTLSYATDQSKEIWHSIKSLWSQWSRDQQKRVRLLGVGVSDFAGDKSVQGSLFEDESAGEHRQVDQTIDSVRAKFGMTSLRSADTLGRPPK